ncbi:MAG: hypothetical protein A3H52_01755 [Candidatus Zambryskibacteria bacterium RIFCSPLOWO2_02_FULL_39_26]|uniref:Uncharacterized protein n=1 Tax=Candidatus Zambryskibacteria bacterium RIFCSPLOWO2_12_FULL_39_23 TaxID=1802776 RepID=A0A1G2USD7_9BACT|nr:MAG: hypothetical protein A2W51_02720 [Candidatus Zambryskibacteria bacterium RIFCSPHIGHO2_02_39_10]OHB00289.1 MAG: hypothetical protein A3E59_00900 [Candidatus Zambryskibacteria bacterium RIFCSPHIGHO2_12_FULL_39_47]OHB09665.1 MAG: hypothetical protein A3H52_01755 [Candidatus Zambryskibacteria bacterium RIFCSPLOWO2_02_FULL_39_26]OHB12266.1 MAG: hypothetical protein A3G99_00695 [Candidatus Zambryskibacteria bacterium RIFCSPLOWO2_12_FULL_39_23]
MKNMIKKISIISSILLPATSLAALDGLRSFLTTFGGLLNQAITIVFGLAVVYFFWGIGQFVLHAGDQKMRDEGKKKILWGVIALFVMVSIWGIVKFIGDTLGVETDIPGGLPAPDFRGDVVLPPGDRT